MDSGLKLVLPSIEESSDGVDKDSSFSSSEWMTPSQSPVSCSPLSSLSSFSSTESLDTTKKLRRISKSSRMRGGPSTAPVQSLNTNMFAFTRSISALNSVNISVGVIRAKNAFLKSLSGDTSPAQYKKAGDRQWEKIASDHRMIFHLGNVDFSDIKLTADQTDTKVKVKSPTMVHSGPPPPPPPPSAAPAPPPPPRPPAGPPPPPPPPIAGRCGPPPPPPPPGGGVMVSQQRPGSCPAQAVKLVKLHWRTIPADCARPGTIWSSAPSVTWDRRRLESHFRLEEKGRRSSVDLLGKPKELLVLDSKRSNQINIGIKNLPPLNKLQSVIEEMDDSVITKEGVEKLQGLTPTEEEISAIKEAHRETPDLPLGSAEQFLLLLDSISGLDCKLKLWAFKVDFKAMEKDICEPLKSLKEGMKSVRSSKLFPKLVKLTLEIGNFLNASDAKGFQLDFLSKLSWVKDTVTKKTLLYHIIKVRDRQTHNTKTNYISLLAGASQHKPGTW